MSVTLKHTVEEKARALAEPLAQAEGLEFVDVEFIREQAGWILRVFIDKPGGKVGLDDCTAVSRALDPVLDVEDFIPHEYHLEVSSPGLNRPLKKPEHFQRVVGQVVKVKTFGPVGDPPRKSFKGVLKGVEGQAVTLEVEGAGAFQIPLRDIARANLEFEF